MRCAQLAALLLALLGADATNAAANPILDPAPFTKWVSTSGDGLSRKAVLSVPFVNASGSDDSVNLWRVDLVGNAQQRGFAQGELLAVEIWELLNVSFLGHFFLLSVDAWPSTSRARFLCCFISSFSIFIF
jgi:hypothetical protein